MTGDSSERRLFAEAPKPGPGWIDPEEAIWVIDGRLADDCGAQAMINVATRLDLVIIPYPTSKHHAGKAYWPAKP